MDGGTVLAGYYAWRYLGAELSRDDVMADIDRYLSLEREAVLALGRGQA